MKLVRYGNPGKEKPGLIDATGQLRDLSSAYSIKKERLGS
jgi:2,4-didehydro-3-deoxy-L-rhamnonate hydrolase